MYLTNAILSVTYFETIFEFGKGDQTIKDFECNIIHHLSTSFPGQRKCCKRKFQCAWNFFRTGQLCEKTLKACHSKHAGKRHLSSSQQCRCVWLNFVCVFLFVCSSDSKQSMTRSSFFGKRSSTSGSIRRVGSQSKADCECSFVRRNAGQLFSSIYAIKRHSEAPWFVVELER